MATAEATRPGSRRCSYVCIGFGLRPWGVPLDGQDAGAGPAYVARRSRWPPQTVGTPRAASVCRPGLSGLRTALLGCPSVCCAVTQSVYRVSDCAQRLRSVRRRSSAILRGLRNLDLQALIVGL